MDDISRGNDHCENLLGQFRSNTSMRNRAEENPKKTDTIETAEK